MKMCKRQTICPYALILVLINEVPMPLCVKIDKISVNNEVFCEG